MAAADASGPSGVSLLMVDLLAAVYWFDDALQSGLKTKGWSEVTRAQSLVLANMTAGVQRASQLAKNLGVSHQPMSQTLAPIQTRGLIPVDADPSDPRTKLLNFTLHS